MLTPPSVHAYQRQTGLATPCSQTDLRLWDENATLLGTRTLKRGSTSSSNPRRLLGAAGDARCFDDAEPRRGPPSQYRLTGHNAIFPARQWPHLDRPLRHPRRDTHACGHEEGTKYKVKNVESLLRPPLAFALNRAASSAPAFSKARSRLARNRNTRCWDAKCSSVALAACAASPLAL